MKINDSGMPEQAYWNSLFDLNRILSWMQLPKHDCAVVEIGCGYGTFTVPVASAISGQLSAFDIEQTMLEIARENARLVGLSNINFIRRDVLAEGTGLADNSVERILLFNILHFSEKQLLLKEAARILKPGGQVDILHWRNDIPTPRGPDMLSRPDTPQILEAINGTGLGLKAEGKILPPYHWGLQLIKDSSSNQVK